MYTMAEFRKNLRQAFRDAREGHEVVIGRFDEKYQLVSLVGDRLGKNVFESIPGKEPRPLRELQTTLPNIAPPESTATPSIPQPTPVKQSVLKPYAGDLAPKCKVHGTPLDSRGRCLQKGCKYA